MDNKEKINKIYRYIFLGLSFIIIITAFFTSATFKKSFTASEGGVEESVSLDLKYNGWSFILGEYVPELEFQENVNQSYVVQIKPSIMIIIAYFLPFVASIVMMLLKKDNRITGFVMTACFLFSAIMLFMTLNICSMNIQAINGYIPVEEGNASLSSIGFSMSYGPILGALFACIGTIISFKFAMQKESE